MKFQSERMAQTTPKASSCVSWTSSWWISILKYECSISTVFPQQPQKSHLPKLKQIKQCFHFFLIIIKCQILWQTFFGHIFANFCWSGTSWAFPLQAHRLHSSWSEWSLKSSNLCVLRFGQTAAGVINIRILAVLSSSLEATTHSQSVMLESLFQPVYLSNRKRKTNNNLAHRNTVWKTKR